MVRSSDVGGGSLGSGRVLKHRLQPADYLDTRTDEHAPQSDIDFDDTPHGVAPLRTRRTVAIQFPSLR